MRIGIFLYTLGIGRVGGIQQYIEHVIEGLTLHSEHYVVLFCSPEDAHHYQQFIKKEHGNVVIIVGKKSFISVKYLNGFLKEFYLFCKKIRLLFLYKLITDKMYSSQSIRKFLFEHGDFKIWVEKYADIIYFPYPYLNRYDFSVPSIITIHDLQHKVLPQNFSKKSVREHDKYYKSSAENATEIIVSHQHVKDDIKKYYRIPENKINVCEEGFEISDEKRLRIESVASQVLKKYSLTGKTYMIYPGAPSPHKNHSILIEAMNILKEKYRTSIYLVITGKKNASDYLTVIEKNIKQYQMEDFVVFTGFVDNDEIYALMIKSAVVIVPTLYESRSLPVDEALCLGAPVLASNVTAIPDQVGDNRFVFNPDSSEEIAQKLYSVLNDEQFKKENIANSLKQKKLLIWENRIRSFLNTFALAYSKKSVMK